MRKSNLGQWSPSLAQKTLFGAKKLACATVFAAIAQAGVAQTGPNVTLISDDGDELAGELLDFSADIYVINSVLLGRVEIPTEGWTCEGAGCPSAEEVVAVPEPEAEPEQAEPASTIVVLTAKDGSVSLEGDLLAIEGDEYILLTDAGEVQIKLNLVDCEGEACPVVEESFEIGGPIVLTSGDTQIKGKLIGLEEDSYLVDAEIYGEIRVSRDTFDCSGEGCPTS